jgi:hypothetical protein
MPPWPDDVSKCTLEEIVRLRAENQVLYKELRRASNALMNSKLSKQIGHEEYTIKRQLANKLAAEYQRRRTILARELFVRRYRIEHSQTFASPRSTT